MEPEVKDIIFDTNLKQVQQEMKNTAEVAKMMGKAFKENTQVKIKETTLEDAEAKLKLLNKEAFKLEKALNNEGFEMSDESIQTFQRALDKVNDEIKTTTEYIEELKKATAGEDEFQKFEQQYSQIIEGLKKASLNMPGEVLRKQLDGFEIVAEKGNATIIKIGDAVEDTGEKAEEAGEKVEDIGKKVDISFNGGLKQLRRFTLGLIGIRSVWTVLTRASHTYMNENKVINEQLKLTFSILGQAIGPVVKQLVNIIEYGAILIAKVVQFFTGVNVLANASAAALKNLSKQAKKTQNALASFDTITNMADNADAMEDYVAALSAYTDFQEKMASFEEWWKDWDTWVIGGLLALGSMKVLNAIAGLIGVTGAGAVAGTGLAGVAGLLGTIAAWSALAIEIVLIMKGLADWYKWREDFEETEKAIKEQMGAYNEILQDEINKYIKLAKVKNKDKKQEEQMKKLKEEFITLNDSLTQSYKREYDQFIDVINSTGWWSDATEEQMGKMAELVEKNKLVAEGMTEVANANQMTTEEAREYIIELQNQITNAEKLQAGIKSIGGDYESLTDDIEAMKLSLSTIKDKYSTEIIVNADTKNAENKLASLFEKYGMFVQGTLKALGINTNKLFDKIYSFDVGTNYIPQDQLAMVHKGEMIVPKQYNPATSGIGGANEETNELLRQLNTTLEQKQFNGYISANDITNTAIQGINQQSRALGRSVIR